jgi:hypothetical protein
MIYLITMSGKYFVKIATYYPSPKNAEALEAVQICRQSLVLEKQSKVFGLVVLKVTPPLIFFKAFVRLISVSFDHEIDFAVRERCLVWEFLHEVCIQRRDSICWTFICRTCQLDECWERGDSSHL